MLLVISLELKSEIRNIPTCLEVCPAIVPEANIFSRNCHSTWGEGGWNFFLGIGNFFWGVYDHYDAIYDNKFELLILRHHFISNLLSEV